MVFGILVSALASGSFLWAGPSAPSAPSPEDGGDARPFRILCLREPTIVPTIPADHSWPRQLEELLNEDNAGRPFAVLNTLPGAGTKRLEANLPLYLDRYAPDMVVAMMPADSQERLRRIVSAVRARGTPMIFLQYPWLDGKSLRERLPDPDGVGVVDNKASFDTALARGKREDYFLAGSSGSFRHCTAKGDRLIADNAAREILKRLGGPAGHGPAGKASPERVAENYRRVAAAHHELGDDAGAGVSLGGLLRLFPDRLDALRQMARVSWDEDRRWEALNYAERAAAGQGAAPDAERAEDYRLAGEIRAHLGDFPAAAENFSRALALKPDDAGLLRGLAEARRDRPDEALDFALRAGAFALAAELRIDLGDLAGAEKELRRSRELAADDLEALHAMVNILRGRRREAIAYAERAEGAAGRAPRWRRASAYRFSARIWLELEDYSRAAENLRRALALNPDDIDALAALVRIKSKLSPEELRRVRRQPGAVSAPGEDALADEASLQRALEREPNDLDSLRMLIELKRDQRRPLEAAGYAHRFMRAVWKAPLWQQADAGLLGARLWLELGDDPKAYQSLERALDLDPDSVEIQRRIIQLGPHPGEDDTAEDAAATLSSLHAKLAELRIELQDVSGAVVSLERALELQPDNEPALRRLASLKLKK